jgi:hypothetical protein
MDKRTWEWLAAACGALYVVLLVGGDDFINPAGEPPEPDASLREVTAYLDRADSSSFWLGRSIGLLALCALLVFVAYVSRRIRQVDGQAGLLSGVVLAAGSVAVGMQMLAAPAQFAAVQGSADGLDPQVAKALLHVSASFHLSFLPLSVFLGAVAIAGLRHGLVPRWLALVAGVLPVGFVAGLIGRPEDPAVVAYMAFGLSLLWFVAASVVLARRVGRPAPARNRVPGRAAAVAGGLLALVLTAGLAACGDDDKPGLSKADYIAKSGAICAANGKKADAAFKSIVQGAPRTATTAHRFVSEAVVPIFSDSVSRRAKLPAPDGDEQEIAALNRAGRQAQAEFERIAARPSRSAALMLGRIPDPAKDYDARSRRYGIAKCGGDQS